MSRVDWVAISALIQATATVVLVVVTIAYVRHTKRMAGSAIASAEAAERSVEAFESSARAATMPILIVQQLFEPPPFRMQSIVVRFENIGPGIAMWTRARLLGPSYNPGTEIVPWSYWHPIASVIHSVGQVGGQSYVDSNLDPHDLGYGDDINDMWGAIDHHDEWTIEIEYESILGIRHRVTYQARPQTWHREVISQSPMDGFGTDGVLEARADEVEVRDGDDWSHVAFLREYGSPPV